MTEPKWLQVTLTVDGELAEAVADVLARFAPNGVAIETTGVTANPDDSEGRPVGPLRVSAYLPVDAELEETRRRLEEALWYLGRIRPLPVPEFAPIAETDWSAAWKVNYRPIPIGDKLIIVPAWLESPSQNRIPIRIDPGMAFGTGTHPTTQLCLELVETILVAQEQASGHLREDATVIDLGCGTAILAVAALKLGVTHALGVDIDPEAVRAAQENAQANGVAGRLEVGLGSLAEIQAGNFSICQAPLVLANILAPVLIRLLDEGLVHLLTPEGALVLSGILAEQCEGVVAAGERNGLALVERRQIGDWVALWLQRQS